MLRHAMRALVPLTLAAVAASCSGDGGTGPRQPALVRVAYLDNLARLNVAQAGTDPELTPVVGALPFASTEDGVILRTASGYSIYHPSTRELDTLPLPASPTTTAGAVSPDGSLMSYVSTAVAGTVQHVYIHLVSLTTGARDSVDVANRDEIVAAPQVVNSTPVFSPSGDSVAFLLPNPVGMQLLILEVPTKRVEVHPVPVSVSVYYTPLVGWPRWTQQATIRFLARRKLNGVPMDTLVVLEVYPRQLDLPAHVVYAGAPPDSVAMADVNVYSFNGDGSAVAFGLATPTRSGIFTLRRGEAFFRPVVFQQDLAPRYPLIVP